MGLACFSCSLKECSTGRMDTDRQRSVHTHASTRRTHPRSVQCVYRHTDAGGGMIGDIAWLRRSCQTRVKLAHFFKLVEPLLVEVMLLGCQPRVRRVRPAYLEEHDGMRGVRSPCGRRRCGVFV
jgi:hypothetical protein